MIRLFDVIRNALQLRSRVIQLARNLDAQLRMPEDRVVVDRHSTIHGDNTILFRRDQRIHLQRTRFGLSREIDDRFNGLDEIIMETSVDRRLT